MALLSGAKAGGAYVCALQVRAKHAASTLNCWHAGKHARCYAIAQVQLCSQRHALTVARVCSSSSTLCAVSATPCSG